MKFRNLFLGALSLLAFFSCQPDAEPVVKPVLELSTEKLVFGSMSDMKVLNITANNAWTITADVEWLNFSETSGEASENQQSVNVYSETNPELEDRTGKITVTAGGLTKEVAVTQKATEFVAELAVAPKTLAATAAEGTYTFAVTANVAWTAAADVEWVTLEPATGVASAEPATVTVTVAATDLYVERKAVITVSAEDLVETVELTQAPKTLEAEAMEGEGTEASPYLIKSVANMLALREAAAVDATTYFRLENDVDMAAVTNWVPVNWDGTFSRQIHFDGNNKTISNFAPATWTYLAEPAEGSESTEPEVKTAGYHSLFGVLYGSVKNLTINNVEITGSNACGVIGGYVGTGGKPGLVENVTITNAKISSTGDRAGGVCGNAKEATFRKVSFQGSVATTYKTDAARSGGFVGNTETTAVFEECSADVVVTGESNDLGGFVGKTTGNVSFEKCNVKAIVSFNATTQNRCGGFIGWNSAVETTINDCHILPGSSITSSTTGANLAGFIGYGDADATTTVNITNSSSEANVNSQLSPESSPFIGMIGYDPVVNITNCYAKGNVVTSKNYIGGIVGRVNKAVVTITKCNFQGTLQGASGVAGLVGGVEGGTVNVYKSYTRGTITASAHNSGGLIGLGNGPIIVENSYADVTFTQTGGQFGGGIVGAGQNTVLSIKNCFATGVMEVSRGVGGIIGKAEGSEKNEVLNCISWMSKIKTNRGNTQYSVGGVVGVDRNMSANFKSCYRRADMVLEDVVMTLTDHEDVDNSLPVYPVYTTSDNNQRAYHGKAAAADATISSVATTLGWDETIWDLSGDVPALK